MVGYPILTTYMHVDPTDRRDRELCIRCIVHAVFFFTSYRHFLYDDFLYYVHFIKNDISLPTGAHTLYVAHSQ